MADLIVTMLLLLAASRALGELFDRMGQSPVAGEVMAGMLLGPYALKVAVLDAEGLNALQAVADLGVFLLVFLAGLEMDIEEVARALRGRSASIGALAFLLPFLAGVGLGMAVQLPLEGALFLGLALGLTALPVSVRILMDLGLTEHTVGKVIVSAAILIEVITLTLLGVLIAFQDSAPESFGQALLLGSITVLKTFLLFSIVLTVVQVLRLTRAQVPGAQRAFRQALAVLRGRESLFALAILFVLTFAGVSQVLGLHFVVGAFFGGLLITPAMMGEYNYKQVYRTTSAITFGFLAPIFFGFIGLQFIPDAIIAHPVLAATVLAVGFASKVAGGYLGALVSRRSSAEGLAIGFGLTIHGVLELVVANLAFQLGIFTAEIFSIVFLLSLVSTVVAPPLLRWSTARLPKAPRPDEPRGTSPGTPLVPAPVGGGPPTPEAPVVIVGGGRVATEIAKAVGPCSILERDPDQARMIAALLVEGTVHIGSATDESDLKRAGVVPGATVLAVTDRDEANEFVVTFARRVGARRIIARTERTAEAERLRELGADAVLNSAAETANAILLELYPPDATMVELLVPKGSPAVGRSLAEIDMPRGTVVRSVERRGRVLVPTPDSVIEPRDRLIISGSPSRLKAARENLLGPGGMGEAINVLACHSANEAAARDLAKEVSALALLSRGALLATVPWEQPSGPFGARVEAIYRETGAGAEVVRGYAPNETDIQDALATARVPPPDGAEPGAAPQADARIEQSRWLVALHHTSLGKAKGALRMRQVASLPSILGSPVYVARVGHPPRSVTALIDGAEAADRAGVLACDIARLLNARLTLLVVRFEDEPEPLEQAAFVEGYARNVGLGTVERVQIEHAASPVVERQLRRTGELLVAASIPRVIRGRVLGEVAAQGSSSLLLA